MSKLLLVAGPLALYAVTFALRALLGATPTRRALNVELALLLALYFLATAGLGIFWVANQQLPPFDLHYLFGYASLALVLVHLALNLRAVVLHFRRGAAAGEPLGRRWLAGVGAALLFGTGTFFLGVRAGSPRLPASYGAESGASMAAVEQTHATSSHSRRGVVLRAPAVAWDTPVPPTLAWPERSRVPLPAPRIEGRPTRSVAAALDRQAQGQGGATLESLSLLLHATAGITERRGGLELRASASSGALFPTEVYVLARDVRGLAPAVYAYAPREHALVDLGRAPPDDPATGLSERSGRAAPLALVFTSVLRRTGQKYRDRAYRYAVADAGHALGNALLSAAALDLSAHVIARFDDAAVASALGVDGESEAVLGLVEMFQNELDLARGGVAAATFAPVALVDPSSLELGATALAHDATSLAYLGGPARPNQRPAPPDEPSANLFELIQARRSVRTFDSAPITARDLAWVLDWAVGPEAVVSRALRAHVIASRVEGLDSGALHYDPAARSLTRTRAGDLSAEAGRAALDQEVVASAHAAIVLSIDRRTLAAEGARGYRHALLEAGVIGARLYLAAQALRLGGCSVGAFYDDEAAALVGVDPSREWPLHFFALGRPAR